MNMAQLNNIMNQCQINHQRLESRVAELESIALQLQSQLSQNPSDSRMKVAYSNNVQQIRSLKQEMHKLKVQYSDAYRKAQSLQLRENAKMQRKMITMQNKMMQQTYRQMSK